MAKTALVFGHTSGLGLELTKSLTADGYHVIGFARSSVELENLVNIQTDLSKKDELEKAISTIQKEYPSFKVLAFIAGALAAHDLDNLSYEDTERLFHINTFAPMYLESHLLPLIRENGTDVINITSSALVDSYPTYAEYSASKAALSKFTKDLHSDLAKTNARVMDICPSGFTSNIYKNMTGDKVDRDESKQMKSSDLAELILSLINLPKIMEVSYIYVNRK